jgi:DNA-binding response OmpR family regulator
MAACTASRASTCDCIHGEKAKELIDERLPEVVTLDWSLPDMTGLSLLSALRLVRRTKDLGVIVLSERHRGDIARR